jgi:superfamily I DNA/RNA helicase
MFRLPVYQELSKEQDIVTNLPLTGRHLVVGPPGTGKTVVAIYRAELWKNAGWDSQFIVYNNTLDQYLGLTLEEKNLGDKTSTFHKWFWHWYRDTIGTRPPQLDRFVFDWNAILMEVGRRGSGLKKIPNLIIDEGQDFPRELYTVLSLIVENLTVFADENQRITAANSTIRDIQHALGIKKAYKLSRNYRNTRPIAEFAAQFYAGMGSGVADLPDRKGSLPYLLMNQNFEGQITVIEQYARINRNKQIGVFVNRQDKQFEFFKGLKLRNPDIPVQIYQSGRQYNSVDFKQNGIFLLCYPSTKGLEFDTVFHPDLQDWRTDGNPDLQKMQLYVLTSRARNELILMSRENNVPPLMLHVPENLYSIRNVHVAQNN